MFRRIVTLYTLITTLCCTAVLAQSISYSSLFDNSTFSRSIDLARPVGTIEGASGTAPSGAATYTIPIKCPPGTHGMAPQIAVVYNSQGGNGMLGKGWSLSGLSTITRAGKDFYHDGKVSPVSYTNDDAFMLDGQRLVPTSGNNGDAGTSYRTEAQSYSVVTSNETIGGGPRYFNVMAKDGSIMQYGYTDDARFVNDGDTKIMMWRLNKVQDVNGNYITFHYDNSDRDSRLVKVSYTGNSDAGLSPYNEINFVYAQRSDESLVYDGGYSFRSKYLLWQINIKGESGDLFKSYQFDYGKNNVGASYLKLVEEFAPDNSKLNDTRFKYGENTNDEVISDYSGMLGTYPTDGDVISPADLDGDGLDELVVSKKSWDHSAAETWTSSFTIKKRTFASTSYSDIGTLSFSSGSAVFENDKFMLNSYLGTTADFNGDGRSDIMVSYSSPLTTRTLNSIQIYYANSSGSISSTPDYTYYPSSFHNTIYKGTDGRQNYLYIGDFNGDGISDFVTILNGRLFYNSPSTGIENKMANDFTTSGGSMDMPLAVAQYFWNADAVYVVNADGDAKSDLMIINDGITSIFTLNFDIVPYFLHVKQIGEDMTYPNKDKEILLGDFNGDGKTDILTGPKKESEDYTKDWIIGYFNGTSFIPKAFTFDHPIDLFSNVAGHVITDALCIGDFDGDGKSDIYDYYYSSSTLKEHHIYYNAGTNFQLKKINTTTVINPSNLVAGDFNGDGKSDLVANKSVRLLSFNPFEKTKLLEKVTDGFNRTTEFIYDPLTQGGDIYTKGSGESYPVNNGQYPVYVVTSLKTPDGIGGISNTALRYENLRLHRAGRGLLGFEKIRSINFTTGIETQTQYELNTDFYVPYLKSSKTFLSRDASVYSLSTTNYTFLSDGPGKCFTQINPSGSSEDLLSGWMSSYSNTYDGDGNITSATSTLNSDATTTLTTTTTETNYTKVAGSPFFNAPADITVTTQRTGKPSVMDKKVLEYDSRGRLIHSYANPGGLPVGPYTVHKHWEYDDYGNKTMDNETCISVPHAPVTHYEYDAQGRFLTKKTNIFGDYTTYTNHKFWGSPLSSTGVSGLTSTNTYDAWGKLQSSTVPVSSSVSYTINYSDGWDPGTNQLYYTLVQDPSAPDVKTWYDQLGRTVKTQQEHSSGTWTNAWTQYNTRGNVWKKSNMYLPTETPLLVEYAYDDRNRLSTETTPTGTTAYAYSFSGGSAVTTVTLPDHKVKKSKTDASGKLVESDNGLAGTVVFDYDSRGNELRSRMKITPSSGMSFVEKEYDQWGRLVRLDDADAGKTTYTYNAFGQLLEQKDPKGKTTYFRYENDFGRLREKELDGMTTAYTYYDKLKGYQLRQQSVVSTRYGTVTDEYDYTDAGSPALHTKTTNGVVTAKSFTYDDYGRPLVTEYSSGLGARNHYDGYGFLQKITTNFTGGGPGERTLYEANARRGDGQIQRFTRSNGLATEYLYEYGTPIRVQDLSGIYDQGVGYDFTNGNVLGRADVQAQTQELFTYDAADRLTSSQAEKTDGSGTIWPSIDLEYDKPPTSTWTGSFGRIVSKSDAGAYQYAGFPRNAVASITDPGNLVSHETQEITYTPFHKADRISEMIGVTAYEENFVYDAAEDRAYSEQKQGGVIQHQRWYMGDYELDRFAGSADQQIHYISGEGGLCAIVIKEGPVFTYYSAYTDHLGSIVLLTDETGTAVYRQSYDPWGRERNPETWEHGSGWGVKPRWLTRGYTGHEMLPEYGLINMNGRMYDPLNGRMLRPDNYVTYPDNTQSYNRYSYAMNNPLSYTDPDGNNPLVAAAIIGGVMGGVMYTFGNRDEKWDWAKFGYAVGTGVVFGVMGNGIGTAFTPESGLKIGGLILNEAGRAGAHGVSGYISSGGNINGFYSGAFGSAAGSIAGNMPGAVGSALNTTVGGTAFAAVSGGVGSSIGGGDFWQGAAIGATVHLVNYNMHKEEKPMNKRVNPLTLRRNWFGSSYIGPNNPTDYDGYSNYDYLPASAGEYPAITHDIEYDAVGAKGAKGVLFNLRTVNADLRLFRNSVTIAGNPYINIGARFQAAGSAALIILTAPKILFYNSLSPTNPVRYIYMPK